MNYRFSMQKLNCTSCRICIVILTDGASGLLQSSSELQPGPIVTIVLDLVDQFEDGSDHQIRFDTSEGATWVGRITIGQENDNAW